MKTIARVGIGTQEVLESPHVCAGLQDPTIAVVMPLQVLQLLVVKRVDVRPVGVVVDPVFVRRHPELIVEQRRAHGLAHHRHALLRERGAHRVHRLEPAIAFGLRLGRRHERRAQRDPRVGLEGLGLRWRRREHRLPREGRPAVGILGEDVVQDRGSRAGKADDEHRRDDLLVGDRGEQFPIVDVVEAVHGVPEGALAAISRPMSFRRASRSSDSRNNASGSTNGPSPRSSRPLVRRAASVRIASTVNGSCSGCSTVTWSLLLRWRRAAAGRSGGGRGDRSAMVAPTTYGHAWNPYRFPVRARGPGRGCAVRRVLGSRWLVVFAAGTLTALVIGGVSWAAQTPVSGGVVHGCYNAKSGAVKLQTGATLPEGSFNADHLERGRSARCPRTERRSRPAGCSGVVGSLDQLAATPCNVGNPGAGTLSVSYASGSGVASVVCVPATTTTSTAPCGSHSNGLGRFYVDCAAQNTYNLTTATEAGAASSLWNGSNGAVFICGPVNQPLLQFHVWVVATGSAADAWAYDGTTAVGHVSTTQGNGGASCPILSDPQWH